MEVLVVVCVPDSQTAALARKNILTDEWQGSLPLFSRLDKARGCSVSLIICESAGISETTIEASDALLMILDGERGLDPASVAVWNSAIDHSIPRHLGAVRAASGRADFDELVAIAVRVLEPDALVRYLPIESEDDDTFVGQYDLLTGDIHDCTNGTPEIRHGDPEHVALTADRRDDLFEELAHAGLADEFLDIHLQGLPVSIPGLVSAWNDDSIVAMTALDNGVGTHIVQEWLSGLCARWIPTVDSGGQLASVAETQERLGVGVGPDLARMWGEQSVDEALELVHDDQELEPLVVEAQTSGVLLSTGLVAGQTVRVAGSDVTVLVPRF